MKKITYITCMVFGLMLKGQAQEKVWTLEECMQYAVDHSPKVHIEEHTHNTYKAEHAQSIASFLPAISTQVSAGYGFGRSVDDNYNYTNTTNFSNGYEAYTNLTLFSGGQLINGWRLARVNEKLGKNDIQKAKDDLAIKVMAAYVDVLYYEGTSRYAAEKLEESTRNFYKVTREQELGLKGKADVVQLEAQVAEDDYFLTNQQNLYNTSLLTLKDYMNFPFDEKFQVDTTLINDVSLPANDQIDDILDFALENNPTALQLKHKLKASQMQHLIEKGKLLPTISVSAGIYTDYYKDLKSKDTQVPFSDQLSNKRREYITFRLSFPLFDGLRKITSVKRARNNVRIVREQQTETIRQLQTAIEKAVLDREGYAKEMIQMEKKTTSDQYSYHVTLRKFEEGLMSPLDLQNSSNILLQSRANLLQRKLMFLIKCKEVDYYKGEPLVK
ncbi:TolC family protein [Parabacteroides sp. PF5-9]|uniref:TolC family protein n=1 Tax=Parabacteroides sp. PF5-9 TaxID=1742404 RepID=UPI002473D448|nr:TolC family protein [Parabacteroides sp. PF5-9]MDH6356477.1 outer membrane protein [Parabacteroides sp. PF5-9]